MKTIVLCATNKQLIAGKWQAGKLQSHLIFNDDESGHVDFERYIKNNLNHRIYFLVDSLEEDYRVEQLPHVTGGAKEALISRKLTQIYRNNQYRTALWLNREKTGRKDDRYLMVALTNHEAVQRWVDIIHAQEALLAGVYLLSMVSQTIIKKLQLNQGNVLYSEYLTAGLRQTFYQDGHMRVSRITPIDEDDRAQLAYFHTVETEKTRLYLISQRLITRDAAISMLIPEHLDDANKTLCAAIKQENNIACNTLNITAFSKGLGLNAGQLANQPELLHMHMVAQGAVPPNLAPAAFASNYQLQNIKQSIYIAAALIFLAGIGVSAYFLSDYLSNKEQTEQALLSTKTQENLYQEEAKTFNKTPISSADLQAAVDSYKAIKAESKNPVRLMRVLSQAMALQPEIKLTRLHWLLSNEADPKDNDEAKTDIVIDTNGQQQASPSFTPDTKHLYEFGFVNGEIANFNGDYRSALKSVNQLVEKLEANPLVADVKLIQAPVNVSSYTNLQGSTTDTTENNKAQALFKIRLVLKLEGLAQ